MSKNLSPLPRITVTAPRPERYRLFHELVTSRLVDRGLAVAVVSLSPCQSEREERGGGLFSCHLDNDSLWRYLWRGGTDDLDFLLGRLAAEFDLIVLERQPDPRQTDITLTVAGGDDQTATAWPDIDRRPEAAVAAITAQLATLHGLRPVWACILIGGQSSRMGRPKHLLCNERDGDTWLERTVSLLTPLVTGIALAGGGELPATLSSRPRLCDVIGASGPMAGILAAQRWQPTVSWLLLACDMPGLSTAAVRWLLAQRQLGRWAVVPRLGEKEKVEPLFAVYEPQSALFFERMHCRGVGRISRIAEYRRVEVVKVAAELQSAWRNINTPEELSRFQGCR
ncbi:MAG: molybdenum cofactor guanylyltransferase [Desulfopila sp.]